MKPTLTMYVGIPCSGKSTFRAAYDNGVFVLNADDIQTQVLSEIDYEYSDRFCMPKEGDISHPKFGRNIDGEWSGLLEVNERIDTLFFERVALAKMQLEKGKDVVIDLTCHTQAYRDTVNSWFAEVEYKKLAVVFQFEKVKEKIFRFNEQRSAQGKVISRERIAQMMGEFEDIRAEEAFDAVLYVEALSQYD